MLKFQKPRTVAGAQQYDIGAVSEKYARLGHPNQFGRVDGRFVVPSDYSKERRSPRHTAGTSPNKIQSEQRSSGDELGSGHKQGGIEGNEISFIV